MTCRPPPPPIHIFRDPTCTRTPARTRSFSFVNIFFLFDFLVSVGVKPIVEVSFMPELLASDPSQTVFHYKGGISKPKDYTQWRDLISALAAALEDRRVCWLM